MGGEEVAIASLVVGLPVMMLTYLFSRLFRLKEMKLRLQADEAAERAAQYAAGNAELEARVRILEKIVTDGGYDLAHRIDALREPQRLDQKDIVR